LADALTTARAWLGARELSVRQVRARLARRAFEPADVDAAVTALLDDGTLNDRRVALAAARLEGVIRHRGRVRVLQKIRQLGIDSDIAGSAVDEVFADVDEGALLERELTRKLRGQSVGDLDEPARARLVRSLAAKGFAIDAILKHLR